MSGEERVLRATTGLRTLADRSYKDPDTGDTMARVTVGASYEVAVDVDEALVESVDLVEVWITVEEYVAASTQTTHQIALPAFAAAALVRTLSSLEEQGVIR